MLTNILFTLLLATFAIAGAVDRRDFAQSVNVLPLSYERRASPGFFRKSDAPVTSGIAVNAVVSNSTCPSLTCATGTLAVYVKNGTHLGSVSKKFANVGPVYTVGSASSALLVTLPSTKFSVLQNVFNIATNLNEPDSTHPFFGAASIVDPIGTGENGYAFLTGTVASNIPTTAVLSTSKTPSLGESKIFKLDCASHHLLVDWINDDGSHFPATFFFFPDDQPLTTNEDGLGIYGDRKRVQSANDVRLIDVNLKFIPSHPCPATCLA